MFRPLAAAALLGLFAVPAPAADPADDRLAKTTAAQFDRLRTETLPNGLRVYLLPIPASPVVTTKLAYKVGSADEEKDQTGLSHYLEHLLFKGTDKLVPGDIDRITQRNGGRNNAYTNEDMTVYHFDFAADRWEQALAIEADRMRNTRIDKKHEFEQEKGAVVAELKGGEDGPWELEYKAILPLLFPKNSPYAHPVIGEEAHVRAATAEIITRYYDKWYHPNNAVLVIAGGFDPDKVLPLVEKLFGPIPKGELPERKAAPKAEPRTKQVRHEFKSKFDVARAMIGFNTVRIGEPDDYTLDVIADILTSGKTSRLYRRLVEGERLANAVGADHSSGRYPGWFGLQLEMLQGKDRASAERILFEEIEKLAREPVTATELKRVQRSTLASLIYSRESTHNVADIIAKTVTRTGGLDYLKTYLDRVLNVTPADIQRVAAKYLTQQQAVVVWSVPDAAPGTAGVSPARNQWADGSTRFRSANEPQRGAGETPAVPGLNLTDAKRTVLPNGLTLIILENRRLPIVVAEAYVTGVRLRETADQAGVAALVGDLLDEGTVTRTGQEISTAIQNVGGSLSFSSSGGSLQVLTPDTGLGLTLLFDCLMNPNFPAEAIERKRDQLLSVIADIETQPQNMAEMAFKKSVYGKHPFGRSPYGERKVVERLTATDLKKFHSVAFAPQLTTVVVVGDIDADEVARDIEQLTAAWKKTDARKPMPPGPPRPDRGGETIIPDATAAQTHVYVGHLGVTRAHPDYYTLLVMDNVLGTGPGFTDRLSANLRDRQGLAYTVNATITTTATDQPGAFIGYIGTFPDKYLIAREGFLAEIAKIRAEAPSAREVEDAKKYLLGSLAFRLTTNSQVASQLLAAERYGLGFDFLEKYREKVAAVTPADVHEAAKKHLDPNRLVIVAVGPIGKDGKPLPKK